MRFFLTLSVFLVIGLPSLAKANEILRGPYLQNPSKTSITLRYRTKKPTPTLIKYWKQSSPEKIFRYQDAVVSLDHKAVLNNLDPNTFYEYGIESQNKTQFEDISESSLEYQFKTQSSKDEALLWVIGDPGVAGFKNFRKKYKNNQKNVLANFLAYQYSKNLRDPDMILSLGDNTYFYGFDNEYQKGFFDEYDVMLSKIPVYTVFGNHDAGINKEFLIYNSRSYPSPHGVYFDIFESPNHQAYYSFDLGGAHFIVLDSFDALWEDLKSDRSNYEKIWTPESSTANPMLDWLKQDLAANKSNWTIVAFHHPPYGYDEEGSNKHNLWRAWMNSNVVPLIEKHQVDLVLCGHIHNYQRSFPIKSVIDIDENQSPKPSNQNQDSDKNPYHSKIQRLFDQVKFNHHKASILSSNKNKYIKNKGTIYTILGSSGAAFNTIDINPDKMFAVQSQVEGSALMAITASKLSFRYITIKGDIIDEFTIESK
jgi:Icc-related predicted phosphoesterase